MTCSWPCSAILSKTPMERPPCRPGRSNNPSLRLLSRLSTVPDNHRDTFPGKLGMIARDARSRPAEEALSEQSARPLDSLDRAMLQVLRGDGVLAGFTARVDPARLGLTVAALVSLRTEQQSWQAIRDHLLALEEVEYVALTTGGPDFVVLVRAPRAESLRDVVLDRLRRVPRVPNTPPTLILDEHRKSW